MYVRDTLPDSGREKGRSSTGSSDGHRNTQYHKSYLEKQLLLEKEKLLAIEKAEKDFLRGVSNSGEEGEREGEREEGEVEEEEYRGNERGNEAEVGSDIQFSVSITNIYDSLSSGNLIVIISLPLLSFLRFTIQCYVMLCKRFYINQYNNMII